MILFIFLSMNASSSKVPEVIEISSDSLLSSNQNHKGSEATSKPIAKPRKKIPIRRAKNKTPKRLWVPRVSKESKSKVPWYYNYAKGAGLGEFLSCNMHLYGDGILE